MIVRICFLVPLRCWQRGALPHRSPLQNGVGQSAAPRALLQGGPGFADNKLQPKHDRGGVPRATLPASLSIGNAERL